MRYKTAFFMAWGNFFAVPCPCKLWDNELRRLQLIFFPVIGFMMGLIWYGLYWLMFQLGLPTPIQAGLLMAYPFLISGFIHLDGFMDCNDAILSRRSLEERQRILKDSHVGSFAVIAVGLLFILFYSSTWAALDQGLMKDNIQDLGTLILIPFVSRACSARSVLANQPIGHSQYLESYDKTVNKKYIILLNTMLVVALLLPIMVQVVLFFGISGTNESYIVSCLSVVAVMVVSFLATAYGRRQLGGMSGDIAGYGLTLAELAGILVVAIL